TDAPPTSISPLSLHDALPIFRPFLDDVRMASVAGKAGPRHLLAGWLTSRLKVAHTRVHLTDAQHVTMEIKAEHDGRHGDFVVSRSEEHTSELQSLRHLVCRLL